MSPETIRTILLTSLVDFGIAVLFYRLHIRHLRAQERRMVRSISEVLVDRGFIPQNRRDEVAELLNSSWPRLGGIPIAETRGNVMPNNQRLRELWQRLNATASTLSTRLRDYAVEFNRGIDYGNYDLVAGNMRGQLVPPVEDFVAILGDLFEEMGYSPPITHIVTRG